MRKSQRLQLLELRVTRMEMLVDLYNATLTNLLESQGLEAPDIDSGKWYTEKIQKDS